MSTTHNKITANLTQRTDPTNTYHTRQDFLKEVRSRFRRLRGLVRTTVGYENNALLLKQEDNKPLFANAEAKERFEFNTNPQRINEFNRWFQNAIEDEVLEPPQVSESLENHWLSPFIRAAYLAGINRATGLLFQAGIGVDNPTDSEILNDPFHRQELQTLYTRTYENLKDITEDMADVIRRELTTGLAQGENPRKMATRLTDEIRDIQHTRAEALARTETINAVTESTLSRFENNGIRAITHAGWLTAKDTKVCPFCRRLGDKVFTLSEMRDTTVEFRGQIYRLLPPSHVSGRCALLPRPGVDTDDLAPLADRVPGTILT